jgi:hypothetical protein
MKCAVEMGTGSHDIHTKFRKDRFRRSTVLREDTTDSKSELTRVLPTFFQNKGSGLKITKLNFPYAARETVMHGLSTPLTNFTDTQCEPHESHVPILHFFQHPYRHVYGNRPTACTPSYANATREKAGLG